MKARVEYAAGNVAWLHLLDAQHVAGVWYIGQRDAENPARRKLGVPEYAYGKSNWGVYHEPTGMIAAWLRGRRQAEALARQLADVWNGEVFNDAPLETRNKVYRLVQDAPGRVQP